jgi:hypothetical protein
MQDAHGCELRKAASRQLLVVGASGHKRQQGWRRRGNLDHTVPQATSALDRSACGPTGRLGRNITLQGRNSVVVIG